MMRNPLSDPLPGDIFIAPNGHVYEIQERFVAVDESGKETPSLQAKRTKPQSEPEILRTSVSVICAKMRGSTISVQAKEEDVSWKLVQRTSI
jgi:hypothetical protein